MRLKTFCIIAALELAFIGACLWAIYADLAAFGAN
jgi:hypothetical protein